MPTHLNLWIFCWQAQANLIIILALELIGQLYQSIHSVVASAGSDSSAAQATMQVHATRQVRPEYEDSTSRVMWLSTE